MHTINSPPFSNRGNLTTSFHRRSRGDHFDTPVARNAVNIERYLNLNYNMSCNKQHPCPNTQRILEPHLPAQKMMMLVFHRIRV